MVTDDDDDDADGFGKGAVGAGCGVLAWAIKGDRSAGLWARASWACGIDSLLMGVVAPVVAGLLSTEAVSGWVSSLFSSRYSSGFISAS